MVVRPHVIKCQPFTYFNQTLKPERLFCTPVPLCRHHFLDSCIGEGFIKETFKVMEFSIPGLPNFGNFLERKNVFFQENYKDDHGLIHPEN